MNKRKFFSKIHIASPPNLIECQSKSYNWFLKEGIRELFSEISPIKDSIGRHYELYFTDYYFDEPKFDEVTSRFKNITYEAPLRVKVKLVNKKDSLVKKQEIYLGDIPMMTKR